MTYRPKILGPSGDGANDVDGLNDGLGDGLREVVGNFEPDVDGAIDVEGDTDGLEEGGGSVGPRVPIRWLGGAEEVGESVTVMYAEGSDSPLPLKAALAFDWLLEDEALKDLTAKRAPHVAAAIHPTNARTAN